MLVVDASAFASWAFPDGAGDKVSQALVRVMTEEESAMSAAVFPLEALHAAGRALACGRFTPSVHQHVLRLLSRLPVSLAPMRVSPLEFWSWAQSLGLTPNDAAYLKVAVDLKAPLVTMDPSLQHACLKLDHPLITDLP
ncbi:MAG TPA: type II toxin-antitoxin system VapC family toxin [Ramlibacter sp.]|jgi:predicted nucleic acid-binding protein|uniref:type II toxin-antitoxin system VapC family toxin n=1 Tax=Ramlibacter sp. TaxID=1917967 RepID=UPI002D6FCD23|nr:type II toxin-antitoxin system VapC family toxin [Ramlibacter sp.]HZY18616.1 type II toxin-antitoxin system VapC family toxin [Ramlibacter sp.]